MNKKILILDDDINILRAFKRNFRSGDYEIFTCSNPDEALAAMEQEGPFAVVISDYYLERTIGIDFLMDTKRKYPDSVRILITGKADLNIALEAVNKVNIFRILLKPFNTDEFKIAIDESIRQFHLTSIEKVDKLKNEFLSIISHEFRTPFTIIKSYLELIQSKLEEKNNSDLKLTEYLDAINYGSDRILRTINLIVNLAQAQSENVIPDKTYFNLYNLVVLPQHEYFQKLCDEKNIRFEVRNTSGDLYVNADINHTKDIFQHLLENAIIFTPSGQVDVIISNSPDKAYLSVKDTGIGIADEYKEKIFDPFVQEDHGYSRKYDGNGLGLTLVKKYCELNNLTVSLNSSKNKGSIFTITFREIKPEQL